MSARHERTPRAHATSARHERTPQAGQPTNSTFFFYFQVCHGQGSTRDASQTDAARRALVLLADSGALNDEDKSSPAENNLFNGNGNNDSIPIVSAATVTAPPSENDNTCA